MSARGPWAAFWLVAGAAALFLALPVGAVAARSLMGAAGQGAGLSAWAAAFRGGALPEALLNSVLAAGLAAAIATPAGFLLAYAARCSRLPRWFRAAVSALTTLPMLLPTITYGFAIVYALGRQGLVTRLLGWQPFDIYGLGGLTLGYVVYVLPIAFLLIRNALGYVDRRYGAVARLMGDSPWRAFRTTLLRPLAGPLAAAFVQSFFLAFTDFGVPASVGGAYKTVAGLLYERMLGSLPDFGVGAAIAVCMLLPSVLGFLLLRRLERAEVRYDRPADDLPPPPCPARDALCAAAGLLAALLTLTLFCTVALVPFVEAWPYALTPTLRHVADVFADPGLRLVCANSLAAALGTAALCTLLAYAAALVTVRGALPRPAKTLIGAAATVSGCVPGMVLGIAFLLVFSGTPLSHTLALVILCNTFHFLSAPYLMMKGALEKLNARWEATGMLMGDTWLRTVLRVVTPNARDALVAVFAYCFVNAMVTVSAVIFVAGARTAVITSKIKELQHFARFDDIFVLSLLILLVNLLATALCRVATRRAARRSLP